VRLGSDDGVGPVEAPPRWFLSAAVDRTFIRRSLLAVAELVTARPADAAPVEVNLSAGIRWQWLPTLVLDAGVSRRLGSNGPDFGVTVGLSHAFALRGLLPGGARGPAPTHDRRDEQFYYPGSFNWAFLDRYPEAARLFNAFDYGHAVLYEVLYTRRDHDARAELAKQFRYLTTDLLVRPPRFAIAEEAVMPRYARLAWRGKTMFDWAHLLHRQIYDAYADPRLAPAAKDSLIERLTDYYLSRPGYAFAAQPKSMTLMDEQYFSQAFRRFDPEFNGLIWAYHWLQVGLYEPFLVYRTAAEQKAGVQATLARFWSMLEAPPSHMPAVMPMTATIAPEFAKRHPRAAAIFDNLHMAHDIIPHILVSGAVPRERKRDVIYAQLRELADSSRNVMSWDDWREMGDMMGGVAAMGGPAVGILPEAPRADSAAKHRHHETHQP